jgi:glycosyltransferase involved in cell wall biosynthesis
MHRLTATPPPHLPSLPAPAGARVEGGLRTTGRFKAGAPGSPLLSVVTVVYDGAATMEACIRSVLEQAHDNVEFIVVDGGSTDGTLDLLEQYGDRIDYWVSEADRGIFDAMNKGVSLITGDYVLFLGCDDVLLGFTPDLVRRLTDPRCVYYGDVYIARGDRTFDGEFNRLKLAHTNICHQAILYPALVFEKYRYNLRYKDLADHEFNMRCWADPFLRFEYVPVVMAEYNDQGNSGVSVDHAFQEDRLDLVRRYFPEIAPAYRALNAVSPPIVRALEGIGAKAWIKRTMRRWW